MGRAAELGVGGGRDGDAALTARAAEALAEEARLKSQLDSARKHLARLEKVVASERKAKMVAEHAAKVAAAAEALAGTELGPEVGGSPVRRRARKAKIGEAARG